MELVLMLTQYILQHTVNLCGRDFSRWLGYRVSRLANLKDTAFHIASQPQWAQELPIDRSDLSDDEYRAACFAIYAMLDLYAAATVLRGGPEGGPEGIRMDLITEDLDEGEKRSSFRLVEDE